MKAPRGPRDLGASLLATHAYLYAAHAHLYIPSNAPNTSPHPLQYP